MLVLLRQRDTKLFYGVHGEWVSRLSKAASFPTVEEALLFNRQVHLQHMEVVILHSNGRHRVILPVGEGSWTSSHWNVPGTAVHSSNRTPQQARDARLGVSSLKGPVHRL